jgi:hypothetical protein
MIFLTIILVLLLFILWLMLTPIIVYIDSARQIYCVKMTGVVSFSLAIRDETPWLIIRTIFYRKEIDIFKAMRTRKKKKEPREPKPPKEKKERRKKSPAQVSAFLARMRHFLAEFINTWSLHELTLIFDTDNYYLNAILAPAIEPLNKGNVTILTNFTGTNLVRLDLSNRIINLVIITIRLFIDLKFRIRYF